MKYLHMIFPNVFPVFYSEEWQDSVLNKLNIEPKENSFIRMGQIALFVKKCGISNVGWLFNLNSNFIETKPFNESVKKQYVATLEEELYKTFDDDKRVRLQHLLKVIVGLDARDDNSEFVYGVDSYYYIFERMIDSIFGNIKDLRDFNPKAKWQLVRNNYKETNSSELRPDTIIVKGNDVFILDSKFYRFGYTGREEDLPETTSIQKQITYGDYIKKNVTKVHIDHIYNAFLLPYDKTRATFESPDNIQYIGFAKSSWKDNKANHELIHSFLIDLHHVVRTWNRMSHDEDVNFLIEEIVRHNTDAQMLLQGS